MTRCSVNSCSGKSNAAACSAKRRRACPARTDVFDVLAGKRTGKGAAKKGTEAGHPSFCPASVGECQYEYPIRKAAEPRRSSHSRVAPGARDHGTTSFRERRSFAALALRAEKRGRACRHRAGSGRERSGSLSVTLRAEASALTILR